MPLLIHIFTIIIGLAALYPACSMPASSPGSFVKDRVVVVRKAEKYPGGLSFDRKQVNTAQAQKLEDDPDVVAIIPDRPIEVPPVPGPHISWDDLKKPSPDERYTLAPNTWFAKDLHGASFAWDLGWTGSGVKVAVLDEGIDFAHPDLQGCQARVTDSSSPYYGWPIAFDPHAMAYYAATGNTMAGYCDTRKTVTGDTDVFRGRTYTLPGTSKSGTYHIGVHPSYWLPFLIGTWGAPAAVLIADESIPGVYDTVYVDINKDYNFKNDKPCRRGDEISYYDYNRDGLADFSAGMVYFIADGVNPIPASDWLYGLAPPANGSLVAFAGSFGKNDAHGTLVASAIAARGIVGSTYNIPQKPEDSGGMVYGMAPGAGIIQVGNIYNSYADLFDALQFVTLGYDGLPGTGDEADIVNMSFSDSSADSDGWDFLSRYIVQLNETIAPRTTFVAASGNGGPGYGTVSSPGGASTAVTVGAATLYGSTDGFNPIGSADQILFGDIQQWSNRGPSSMGQVKPDVVAVGAWGTGDVPIYGSGEHSWATWGGTSLSAPITSGVLALIYEAYKERHGVFPNYREAAAILKAGAHDLCYNVFEQGAGMIDAARSVQVASGNGGFVIRPSSWSAGGTNRDASAFPKVLKPGESALQWFTIENTGINPVRLTLGNKRLLRTGGTEFKLTTNTAREDLEPSQVRPDYMVDISDAVLDNTDLLRLRISMPYGNFSLSNPASRILNPSSVWMASLLDWTDLNADGILWTDTNANGAVNDGELQESEINPFMFAIPWSDVIELSARKPSERSHDGLMLGLHHAAKNDSIPSTQLKVELEFYKQVVWDWLSTSSRPLVVAPGQTVRFQVRLKVPADAAPGIYGGSLVVTDDDGTVLTVPVSVAVAARAGVPLVKKGLINDSDGIFDAYDNGRLFTSFDWGWRAESGDWRFYFIEVPPKRPSETSFILANARWQDMPSDTDIMIYRPDSTDYFSTEMPGVFGPYGLVLSGSSRRTLTSGGRWPFKTATGGASEWVAGETSPGLNLIQLQNVLGSGKGSSQPINLQVGQVWLDPGQLDLTPGQTSAEVHFSSSMPLSGLSTIAFGFGLPNLITGIPVRQDPADEPSTGKWRKDLTLYKAGMIEIHTTGPDNIDIDVYLLYDADGDGQFDWINEIIAIGGTSGSNEHIRYYLPRDGQYRIVVHGYKVPNPTTFDVRLLIVNGSDIAADITNPGSNLRNATLRLDFPPASAGAAGIIFIGPPEAPGVIPVPVNVEIN